MTENKFFIKSLEKFEKNEEWFNTQFKEIEKYRNKFLAVVNPGEFVVDDNLENLINRLEKKVDLSSVFITAIPKKGVASIL